MMQRTQTLRPLNALLKQALHSRALKRTALGIGAFAPAFAFANPTGGQVVAGNAGIMVPDQDHTIINQASQHAIINWQQFSIGSNQFVQFIQPDSSAVVLNRVVGGDPSQILGNLSANGQVFLVNPNGVFFAPGASIDVQGLIATTLDIKDSDFMAGNYVFAKDDGAPDAGVTNQGTLRANNGYVVLAGDYANNEGVIAAQAGQVVLASGSQMTLTMADDALVSFVVDQATLAQYAGVSNTGSIEADGGVVLMTAKVANALTATAVNNSGMITAHSIQDHNGTIILAATGGDIDESGTLDASATDAGVTGGSVIIRGDGHTEIASTANILAQGDNATGGFVELSGHSLSVRGNVKVGAGGNLLLDPYVLEIISSTGTSLSQSVGTTTIKQSTISTKLNAGSNVTLVASGSIVANGATSIHAGTGTGKLTMAIGTVVGATCGNGSICIGHGTPTITPGYGGYINLGGVTINIKGELNVNDVGGSPRDDTHITLGNVTAKRIDVYGEYITTGALTATSTGPSAVSLIAAGSSDNGGFIKVNGNVVSAGGVVMIQSGGGSGISVTGNINAASDVYVDVNGVRGINTGSICSSCLANNLAVGGNITGRSVQLSLRGRTYGSSSSLRFKVGNVTATRKLSIGASDSSSFGYVNVKTGTLTNTDTSYFNANAGVDVEVYGGDHETVSLGAITDTGPANSSCECGVGNIRVDAHPSGYGYTNSVTVTGAIKSSHGSVSISAGNSHDASFNKVHVANVTGAGIYIDGGSIQTGILTATGTGTTGRDGISIAASNVSYGGPANITTGALKTADGNIIISQSHGTGYSGNAGNVNTGAISAGGSLKITTRDTYSGVSSGGNVTLGTVKAKSIYVDTSAGHGGNITAVSLHATGAESSSGVSLSARATNGVNPAYGNVKITGTGGIVVDHGSVEVSVHGGGGITVSGPITAAGSVSFHASGTLTGFNLAGPITAGKNVYVDEYGVITGTNTLKVGNVTAGDDVDLYVDQWGPGTAKLTVGNITAGGSVYIANYASYGGAVLTAGNVGGSYIGIYDNAGSGQNATLTTGNLTATNNHAEAIVTVQTGGKNDTITTGTITATGVLSSIQSGEGGFNGVVANVDLNAYGSGTTAVTVNGGITLKATGGHYQHTNSSIYNNYTESGSTGQAQLSITGGSNTALSTVKVTGAIAETGMGVVGAQITAGKVTVGGAISMTAAAGKEQVTGVRHYGSSSAANHINYTASDSKVGTATLQVSQISGASLGAVTLKGPEALLFMQGNGNITTGAITITGSGEKFNRKATGKDSLGKTVNYSSSQSVGEAFATLQAGGSSNAKTVNVKGNITINGTGAAGVSINAGTITTQGISITQKTGKFSRTGTIPNGVFPSYSGSSQGSSGSGPDRLFAIQHGTVTGDFAGLLLRGAGSSSSCNSCETPANSITVSGNIAMSAVGDGEIYIAGNAVNITGGITGVATRATVNGSGEQYFHSGSQFYSVAHTVSGSGGRMHVDIRGVPGAGSSHNSDNNYTGTVTIGGKIDLTGPTANVEIKSGNITTHDISVNGTGEDLSVTDVYTPSYGGTSFTNTRSGIIEWTGIDLAGKRGTGKVTTGNLLAEGPLFAAIHIGAGTVTVGNLGVIASSGSATLLDTRISSATVTLKKVGDAGLAISDISGTGAAPVFTPATVNGNINLEATRDVHLLSDITVSGYTLVTAGRNIDDPLPADIQRFVNDDRHGSGSGSSSGDVSTLNLNTGGLALLAGGDIILNDAILKVGTGTVDGVVGDSIGIALLATQGLASTGMLPNATFVAGGTLGLGKFTLTGDYLYMEATDYNLSGPISVPTETVVQFAPVSPTGTIDVEPGTATAGKLNLSGDLLNLFPGTTLMVGVTGATGDVTIGSKGTITLSGGSNFLINTEGNVTGLENILTTGLVGNLIELVNFQVPTANEIQNSGSTSDDTSDEKKKKDVDTGGGDNGDDSGTVDHDDDSSGVCHG